MKLAVDLLACQTKSRFQGAGRYTHSLAGELAQSRRSHQLVALANAAYEESFETLRQEFTRLLPPGGFLPYRHAAVEPTHGEKGYLYEAAAALVRHAYEVIQPDITLYPNVFEGWREEGVVALPDENFPSSLRAAVVHDFIPAIFPDQYLAPDPHFKNFYQQRLDALKKFDLLLAVSEATRRDAIKILGLREDQVVNISAAAGAAFKKVHIEEDDLQILLAKFNITRPFVFCAGGAEFHGNTENALSAYAQLPEEVRRNHQFVLNHPGDAGSFRKHIQSLGLGDQVIVVTSHVSDQDLAALYNVCKLYVHPALYEGIGLPILEAMACGAPVIASNNSAVPEVLGREDALFDAAKVPSIAQAIHTALTDDGYRAELASYGQERVKEFGCEQPAQRTWAALEALHEGRRKGRRSVQVTVPGKEDRPKVAYVSPLPPQRSGIADYSADLLPYLAHYLDIDLYVEPEMIDEIDESIRANFPVFPWTELSERQEKYDTVVYQVGNSKFHCHMFQLLQEIPGVVVLHDFYLSHVRGYMYSTQYLPGSDCGFIQEAGEMHGLFSMVDYHKRGIGDALWAWPMNWTVLRDAQKLVVHSAFQKILLQKYYGNGWYPQPVEIKQLHPIEEVVSAEAKRAIKQKLGINPDLFTFCSFGYVIPTKLIHLTIEAFARYLAYGNEAALIFVGDVDKGPFEDSVWELANRLGVAEHIKITGFADMDTYRDYLKLADAAIQLRTNSRGETSRAVLDCMAFGTPTIVNSHGTLNDYHPDDVVKLAEYPEAEELAQAIARVHRDKAYREKVGQSARNAIIRYHDPEKVAAAYCEVIRAAMRTDDRAIFAPFIDAVSGMSGDQSTQVVGEVSKLATANFELRNQPRLLIDVTNISYIDLRTGIQRVVKNIIRELFTLVGPAIPVELIRISEGKLFRSTAFTEKLFDLSQGSLGGDVPVDIHPGDTVFMLDTSWNLFDHFKPVFDQVRKSGGRIFTMLYDLIPIRFPEFCTEDTVAAFKKWVDQAVCESDEIICISSAVARDVEEYVRQNSPRLPVRCQVSYVHLGADIMVVKDEANIRAEVFSLAREFASPLFLMVGTVEPRKGHAFTLDAFEHLWNQGVDCRLCIVGKIGWNVEQLAVRIKSHPELGKRLFFVENATDAEINLCYTASTALIAASVTEGFGLPIVEAALHGVPVLASDIPVFREVGGEGALYFSLNSPVCLADAVQEMATKTFEERAALAEKVKRLSWRESAAWVLDHLERKQK